MKQFIARSAILLGVMLLTLSAFPSEAIAAPRTQCAGAPFSFTNIQTTQFRAGVRVAAGDVNGDSFQCSDGSTFTAIISERASLRIAIDPSDPSGNTVSVMGPVELGFLMSDGKIINWGGQIRGQGPCGGGVCTVNAQVQTESSRGARARMLERITIDLASHMITHIDVQKIVIEFTSLG